mmetsp:Transcript_2943/g.4985  ORF Transcript_2943/g.4985 Transcript_2943/m.4985 type:complete len:522 (-) Transcript_2943:87-1652(-)
MSGLWSKEMTGADDVALGQPVLRFADLNDNSTRYDHLVAAPSDDDLVKAWVAIGTTSVAVSVWVGIVLLSVLLSRNVRAKPFNWYLAFLMVPDFFMSFFCSIACFLAVAVGHWYSSSWCRFQSWFIVFGIGGNSWMTVIILYQIHKMLSSARRCIRYKNPTTKQVCMQSGAVLLWASFLGIWAILPTSWNIPLRTYPQQGYACVPIEYNFPSSLFYFLVFFPCLSGIPLLYTTYIIFQIWHKSLLPKKGQRRIFAVYMMRIIVTMYFWWLPSIMFKYFIPSLVGPWGKVFFSIWMHLQGIVSAGLMLGKPDINTAVKNLVTCRADPCVACCASREDLPAGSNKRRMSSIRFASNDFGWGSRFLTSVRGSIGSVRSSIGSVRGSTTVSRRVSWDIGRSQRVAADDLSVAAVAIEEAGSRNSTTTAKRDPEEGFSDEIDDDEEDYGFPVASHPDDGDDDVDLEDGPESKKAEGGAGGGDEEDNNCADDNKYAIKNMGGIAILDIFAVDSEGRKNRASVVQCGK